MLQKAVAFMAANGAIKVSCDGAYNTNSQNYVLTSAGPLGLAEVGSAVAMRFAPAMCVLAHREDYEAYRVAL
eukprot:7227051-Lingulodinium_polyedra.AAC.1